VTRAIQPPVATRCCCQFGRVDPPNQSDELDAEVHKAVEQMPVAPGVEEVVDDLLAVCQKDSQEDPEAVVVSMPMSFTASTHTEHTVAVIHVTRPVAVKPMATNTPRKMSRRAKAIPKMQYSWPTSVRKRPSLPSTLRGDCRLRQGVSYF